MVRDKKNEMDDYRYKTCHFAKNLRSQAKYLQPSVEDNKATAIKNCMVIAKKLWKIQQKSILLKFGLDICCGQG